MTTIQLRDRIHLLVDAVKSEELLQRLHELLVATSRTEASGVWADMSDEQRERVMLAYRSSVDEANLTSTEDVMKRKRK